MNKTFGFIVVFLFFIKVSFSQSENVTILQDNRLDLIIQKHIEFNKIQNSIPGYRLQIFSGTGNYSKSNAVSCQQKFAAKFPDTKSYLIFNTPYYIVRVGNFRTKIEAEAFRLKLIDLYPDIYIVKDDIEFTQ